jgi:hypothetical protein
MLDCHIVKLQSAVKQPSVLRECQGARTLQARLLIDEPACTPIEKVVDKHTNRSCSIVAFFGTSLTIERHHQLNRVLGQSWSDYLDPRLDSHARNTCVRRYGSMLGPATSPPSGRSSKPKSRSEERELQSQSASLAPA